MLRLEIESRQHRDLDRTGLSEDFVLAQKEMVARGKIFNGHAHHAVEMLVDVVNSGFQLLPENFSLFGRGRSRRRVVDGLSKRRGEEQDDTG